MKRLMISSGRAGVVLMSVLMCCAVVFFVPLPAGSQNIPAAVEVLEGEDGSIWERVSAPGFGSTDNVCVVALCPFQGQLYATTRNEVSGFELWRTSGSGWEQVTVDGFTNGNFQIFMNNSFGAMIEFDGRLYVAVGSSYEGAFLYNSVGFEIWRFDGSIWEPVISNSRDEDESGTITGIAGCSADDGDTTAALTDAGKAWATDQWAGGVLRIESGLGKGRLFNIISNTADTLVIQQNEVANVVEYTVCDEFVPDEKNPEFSAGAIAAGDAYAIGMGFDENGFGEIWNKNFSDFEIFNGTLYASIAHNYDEGTRIWKTVDGLTWVPDSEYSFGLLHGFDPAGAATGICLVEGTEDRNGGPVCSSTSYFGKSAVGGTETLYVGGTGSTGCNGRGARVLRYDDGQWNFIVDHFVDDNDIGTNENGFGDAGSFLSANFQAWSMAEYDDRLFVGVARPVGARVMYTDSGSADDGAWVYSVGGDAAMPDGFDGVGNFAGFGGNLGAHLYTFGGALYAGTIVNVVSPVLFAGRLLDGADIWRATGPAESLVWSRVTPDGFGDKSIQNFQSFCAFEDTMYVAGSNLFGNFPGLEVEGASGAVVYRMKSAPEIVDMQSLNAEAGRLSVTINWQTAREQDVAGFNVLRSLSESKNAPYRQLNRELLPAGTASYIFNDRPLKWNTTYFYKIEAVSQTGERSVFGPLPATTLKLFGLP